TINPNINQSIYYAENIAAAANNIVQVNMSASTGADIRVLEYSGIATSNALDATNTGIGNGATAATGVSTTVFPRELIVAASDVGSGVLWAGPGFVERLLESSTGSEVEDQLVTSTGVYNASAALPGIGTNYTINMASFRVVGGDPRFGYGQGYSCTNGG